MSNDQIREADTGENVQGSEAAAMKAVDQRITKMAERGDISDPHFSPHFRKCAELMNDWEKFDGDPKARRYLLDEVGREMMRAFGTPPDTLIESKLPEGRQGEEKPDDATVRIDENLLNERDPRTALQTYLHEYRHTMQAEEVTASKELDWQSVDQARVRELSRPYIEPPNTSTPAEQYTEQYRRYHEQFVETDARDFSEHLADNILRTRDLMRGMTTAARSDADRAVEARIAKVQRGGTRET